MSELADNARSWLVARKSADGEPDWLAQRRQAAAQRFAATGLPSQKDEAWRLTSMDRVARVGFELAPPDGTGEIAWLDTVIPAWDAELRVVLVDGRVRDVPTTLPAGVTVRSLREALATSPELLKQFLGQVSAGAQAVAPSAFSDLNSALFADAVLLHVAAGTTVGAALHLIHATGTGNGAKAIFPRALVVVERAAEVTLVETFAGVPGDIYFNDAVTEVHLGEGAVLRHVRLLQEGEQGRHVGLLAVRLDRDARYNSTVLTMNGTLARLDLHLVLAGPGAECSLDGLSVGDGEQLIDHHTLVDHAVPHTTSRQRYKGILSGTSRSVFDGRVRILRDAQKSHAAQENRNLLLSEGAVAHTKPSLEIDADDVKASHGATIGQLDHEALFYLRSRGIAESDARALLTYGFAREILDDVPVAEIRELIAARALDQLPEMQELLAMEAGS